MWWVEEFALGFGVHSLRFHKEFSITVGLPVQVCDGGYTEVHRPGFRRALEQL